MSLTKKVYLTISGYDIKLSDNLTFYQNDQLKLIFYINEYGIDYENNATARALMPVNPLNAILFIENPEGVDSVSSAKIEDNAVTFYLSSEHTQYIGVSRMQLRLFDQDGCAITLPHFTFEIRENIYGSGDVRFQNVVMVDQTGTVILTEDNDMLDVGDVLTMGTEVAYPQVTKTIKELPIKHGLDGTEKLIVEDDEATKQAPLGTIVDEIKQNSQEKIREIESELAQTNAQLSHINNYSILKYGGSYDGVSDNVDAFNLAKSKNIEVYFPQNETKNAIYYFSGNVDFNNIVISSDYGVTISLPTTNYISFKGGIFKTPINVISRDRNNTGQLFGNNYPNYLTSVDVNTKKAVTKINPIVLNDNSNKFFQHDFSSTFSTVQTTGNIMNNKTVGFNQTGDDNGFLVDTIRLTSNANVGSEYKITLQANVPTENANQYISGCIISGTTNKAMCLITNYVKLYVQNGAETGHELNPTVSKLLSSQYVNSKGCLYNVSVKIVSKQIAEFYINGVYLFKYDLGETIKNVDFGYGHGMTNVNPQFAYNPVEIIREENNYSSPLRFAVFGDSISFGEGLDMSWTKLVEQNIIGKYGVNGIRIDNYSVSGATAKEQLEVMKTVDDLDKVDFILIFVGTNDILRNTNDEEFLLTIDEMIRIAKAKVLNKKCVICASPYVWTTRSDFGVNVISNTGGRYRSAIERMVAEHDISFADVESEMGEIFADSSRFILRDNLHPTIQGNSAIASAFVIQILYILKSKLIRRSSWL